MPPEPFGFLVIICAAIPLYLGERLFHWLVFSAPPRWEEDEEEVPHGD